jgi:iron complex outermembrane receptor protein
MVSGFLELSGVRITANTAIRFKTSRNFKGSASTLFGGGYCASLVNLISQNTTEPSLTSLNGTSALGLDVNGFYSQRFKKLV